MVESVASAFTLNCIEGPIRRQFRCRTERNVWVTSPTKIGTDAKFLKFINSKKTKDVYYSTSSWLDPIDLPRLREKTNHYPILLDHDVVFDIDMAPFSLQNIERARKYAVEIFGVMNEMNMYQFRYVAFSGSKGFHLVYKDLAREKFSIPNPKEREERVREERHALVDTLISMGCVFDSKITADTRRIIRVPGTFHGTTGWACTLLEMDVFMQPTKNWIHSIERRGDAVGMPRWKRKKKTKIVQRKGTVEEGQPFLQINSRVSGTKQHHCLALVLNEQESPDAQVEMIRTMMLNECLPVAVQWIEEGKRYVLFPVAKERVFVKKFLHSHQQKSLLNQFERLDHFWLNLPHEPNSIDIILNDKEVDSCLSRPHFEAMGKIVELNRVIESEVWMGNENPLLRVVVIN
jgi:hypothetical protein